MWNKIFRRRAPVAYGHEGRLRQIIFVALASQLIFAAPALARSLRLVALGDSLTAGYSLPPTPPFRRFCRKPCAEKGYDVTIDNAGVSGDTSGGARERLDWALGEGTDGVIVEIGANDMLRGLNPELTRGNIDAILTHLRDRKIPARWPGCAPRQISAPIMRPNSIRSTPIWPKYSTRRFIPSF